MFKTGRCYTYRGFLIKPAGYGFKSHIKYYDDNENKTVELDLHASTIPELLRLIDCY